MLQRVTFLTFAIFSIFAFTGQVQAQQVGVAPGLTFNASYPTESELGFGLELVAFKNGIGWNASVYRTAESEAFGPVSVEASRTSFMTGPSFQIYEEKETNTHLSLQGGFSQTAVSSSVGDFSAEDAFTSPGVGVAFGFLSKQSPGFFFNTGVRYFLQTENVDRFFKPVLAVGVRF